MKSRTLSLEPLFFYNSETAIKLILDEIQEEYDLIIGTILVEIIPPYEFDSFKNSLLEIKSKIKTKHFRLLLLKSYTEYKSKLTEFDIDYFEYLGNITLNGYLNNPNKISQRWNSTSNKLLVLTGIPHRYNRMRLLYKLHQENLLENNSIWSLFAPFSEGSKDSCREYLSDVSDKDYNKFMNTAIRKIDNVSVETGKFAAQTKVNNFTIDPKFFKDTVLSIISETHYYPDQAKNDVSEKTWRAIINHHPFIIAGTTGIRKHLECLGFKTFLEYLKDDYDIIEDNEQRLNSIVENTKYFLNNFNKNKNNIQKDIEHNYHRLLELINYDRRLIEIYKSQYNVAQHEIDGIFNTENYWNIIKKEFMISLDHKQNPD